MLKSPLYNALCSVMTTDSLVLAPEDMFNVFTKATGIQSKEYKSVIMSVNLAYQSDDLSENVQIDGTFGTIGHVLLEYSNGFRMILSAGGLNSVFLIAVSK